MAVVEAGPADAPPVLLLHGEPTWGYLYRQVITPLVDAGLRVVVPDLMGFGRSDKPTDSADYTYARHVAWLREALFDRLDLRGVHYLGQDWGGLLGMRLLAEHPDRFAGAVMATPACPPATSADARGVAAVRRMVEQAPRLDVGRIVQAGCRRDLADAELAAYAAPFPDESFSAGARAFPGLVPNTPDDPAAPANRAAWERLATGSTMPFLCAFSDGDPITQRRRRAGCAGRSPAPPASPHTTIEGAGHFLQEDRPHELGRVVADFVRAVEGADRQPDPLRR